MVYFTCGKLSHKNLACLEPFLKTPHVSFPLLPQHTMASKQTDGNSFPPKNTFLHNLFSY